ncbi:TetR/AcrR family transcriptional regulator [Rugosimonospora africana]|uniref:HTH tetR-type domain-containing protein n=1 Tax=Rugosimonospora africana TaxID=556532 RepID=A0A8J3VPJ3_9ACTN|nr:TetR/AcrR family transcriptional regulator [Rugosimonospora africana]GIH14022.1 hypothetical protein Raf01_21940 [Rugosimonospora africana]
MTDTPSTTGTPAGAGTAGDGPRPGRAPRADAQRNRARVLQTAAEVFAAEGLSVPVHEIARRAGVGTGTVSRHFPTKEDLFAAILLDRMAVLAGRADELAATREPGEAFFAFFATLIHEGAAHRGLAEALAGACDVEAAAVRAGHDVPGRLRALLGRAREAGSVRAGITYTDVKALMAGCLARAAEDGRDADRDEPGDGDHGANDDGANDSSGLDRVIAVVCAGLRATPPGPHETPPGPPVAG